MKQVLLFVVTLLFGGLCFGQAIDFEQISPAQTIQEADVGAMAFADIDNDGDNDLFVTGKGGPIQSTLYRNDGSGNFSEIAGDPIDDVFGGTVGFADVDRDGDQDLLVTGSTSSPEYIAKLYLNDGTGIFSQLAGTPFEPSTGGDFAFEDIDNDQDPDLIMTGFDANGMGFTRLYLNAGDGSFTEDLAAPFEFLKSSSVAFIDIDQDNDWDVLLNGEDSNDNPTTHLYTNDGMGGFMLVPNTPFENSAAGDITVADTDNDGDQDVLICGQNASQESISHLYLNDGLGSFSLLSDTPFPGTSLGKSSFTDFDKDGDVDLLLVGAGAEIIANIYENQGSNNFVFSDSLIGTYLSSIAIGDIDGDQDPDLAIGGTASVLPFRATRMYTNISATSAGLDFSDGSHLLNIFPNPSNGLINLEWKQFVEADISLYTLKGEQVYNTTASSTSISQIQFSQPPGMYLLLVQTSNAKIRHLIIFH